MKTLMHRIRTSLSRARSALADRARNARPALRAAWERFGYAASLLALLALIGTAATIYRNRASEPTQAEPTPTPVPALLSAAAVEDGVGEEEPPEPVCPLSGELVGEYAPDQMRWSDTLMLWQTHDGVDIAAPLGTAVCAILDGTVTQAHRDPLLGYLVRIEHADGSQSLYACLQSDRLAQVGAEVKAGEVIGAVGDTADAESELGAHLHFAMYQDGESVEPPFDWSTSAEEF